MAGYLQRALWWMSWHCKEREGVVSVSPSLVPSPQPWDRHWHGGMWANIWFDSFGFTFISFLVLKVLGVGELSRTERCSYFLSIFFFFFPLKNQPVEEVRGLERYSWLWTFDLSIKSSANLKLKDRAIFFALDPSTSSIPTAKLVFMFHDLYNQPFGREGGESDVPPVV